MPDPNDPNQQQQPQPPAAPKQGFFSNLGSDLASVLSSPTVKEEALPALIGAAGGALTGEKGHPKEQLGLALEGGLQGWQVGQQEQIKQSQLQMAQLYKQAMIKHVAVEDAIGNGTVAANDVKAKGVKTYNDLITKNPALSQQFPTFEIWNDSMKKAATLNADVPSKQQAVASLLASPSGAQYLATNYNITKPGDIPTDPSYLNTILLKRGDFIKQQADLQKDTAETNRAIAGTAEAGSTMGKNALEEQKLSMQMKGTLPAAPEQEDTKELRKAQINYLNQTASARVEATEDKNVQANAKTVSAIKTSYDKEHPALGTDAGRNKAVLQSGYDPLTSKPLPGGAMKPTGKPARLANGSILPNGLHKDANGNVAYVLDGMIYTH